VYSKHRAVHGAGETTLCPPRLGSKEKSGTDQVSVTTSLLSSPAGAWEEEGVVPTQELPLPLSFPESGVGLAKHVRSAVAHVITKCHSALWNIWKRGVEKAGGRARSPRFSLNNPTSCA